MVNIRLSILSMIGGDCRGQDKAILLQTYVCLWHAVCKAHSHSFLASPIGFAILAGKMFEGILTNTSAKGVT